MLIDDDSGKTPNAANKSRQTYHFGYYTKELPLPVEFFFPTAMIKKIEGWHFRKHRYQVI